MNTSILDLTPFIPSDSALGQSVLPDKTLELYKRSAGLYHQLAPQSLHTLCSYMADINSYYSNLIEGNATQPADIRAALRGDYSHDSAQRDLQRESVAHIKVQNWIHQQTPNLDTIFSVEFIKNLHREFYQHIPESLWVIKENQGNQAGVVEPGKFRTQTIIAGQHMPPDAEAA